LEVNRWRNLVMKISMLVSVSICIPLSYIITNIVLLALRQVK